MELFLDTNVLFGYTFQESDLNPYSEDVINSEYIKYSSLRVKKEYEKIYKNNIKEMETELVNAINHLGSNSSSTKDVITVFNKYIFNPSVNSLLEAGLSTRDINATINDLRDLVNAFIFVFSETKKYLYNCINFKDPTNDEDKEVYSKLEATGLKDSNASDFYIVLDAHYVGMTNWKNLCFVTADVEDIVKRKDVIVVCTSLKDIIKLKIFLDYCNKCG